jgi:hypothetical protein
MPVLLIIALLSCAVCIGTATAASAEFFVVLPEGAIEQQADARLAISSAEQDADFFTEAISAKATAADARALKLRGAARSAVRREQSGS